MTPPDGSAFFVWSAAQASNISLGQPINNTTPQSLNIAFPECQSITGLAGDHIALGTITVVNVTPHPRAAVLTSATSTPAVSSAPAAVPSPPS